MMEVSKPVNPPRLLLTDTTESADEEIAWTDGNAETRDFIRVKSIRTASNEAVLLIREAAGRAR